MDTTNIDNITPTANVLLIGTRFMMFLHNLVVYRDNKG